ncbi:MAG: class I SAM-dependent methyltransferase [Pseudomonadota bacterium]
MLRCSGCGVQLLHPQPSNEQLAQIYNEEYQLAASTDKEINCLDEMKTRTAKLYLEAFKELDLPDNPRLLEVGCGWGHFLSEAVQAGFDSYGIEISGHAAKQAAKRLCAEKVLVSTMADAGFPPNSFDVCVMIDVIEHVRNPRLFLEEAVRLIKPGGYLFLVTPSTDCLSARIMGRHWLEYKPEHLYAFSRRSMAHLLKSINCRDLRFMPAKKALNLNFIVAYLGRFSVPVLTSVFRATCNLLPQNVLFRQFVVPAGGMLVLARRDVTTPNALRKKQQATARNAT